MTDCDRLNQPIRTNEIYLVTTPLESPLVYALMQAIQLSDEEEEEGFIWNRWCDWPNWNYVLGAMYRCPRAATLNQPETFPIAKYSKENGKRFYPLLDFFFFLFSMQYKGDEDKWSDWNLIWISCIVRFSFSFFFFEKCFDLQIFLRLKLHTNTSCKIIVNGV